MKKTLFIISIFILPMLLQSCEVDDDVEYVSSDRCQAITQKGTQCKRKANKGSIYCWQHQR